MSSQLNLLKNVVVVSLSETTLWTGRAKMAAEDFGLASGDLPPEAIASLGSKRLISPDALKPLHQIRYKLRRACMEVGTRFLAGFAVSVTEAGALTKKLNDIVAEGQAQKTIFLANFDTKIRAWQEENPKWGHILSAGTPEKDRIGNRIQFGFQAYLVQTPDDAAVAANLLSSVNLMTNRLVEEIVDEANIFVKHSLTDAREKGSQRTVEPMRRLQRKIESLCFIDPCFHSLAQVSKAILSTLPTKGKVEGDDFLRLARLGYLLSDENRFMAYARDIQAGNTSVDAVVEHITGLAPVVSAALPLLDVTPDEAVSLAAEDLFGQDNDMPADKQEEMLQAIASITGRPATPVVVTLKPKFVPPVAPDFI